MAVEPTPPRGVYVSCTALEHMAGHIWSRYQPSTSIIRRQQRSQHAREGRSGHHFEYARVSLDEPCSTHTHAASREVHVLEL